MCLWLRVRSVTAVAWHISPPPQPVTDCGKSLAVTLLSLSPRCCEQEMVDDQFQLCERCGGRQHMVRHDLRTNKSTRWFCPPPPRTNTQTSAYINYHVLCRCRYFWCVEILGAGLGLRKSRKETVCLFRFVHVYKILEVRLAFWQVCLKTVLTRPDVC